MLGLKDTTPTFAHLPLLLNDKGQKLSKRFGDVSVKAYMDKGYLPEAMINSLALLGWNMPQAKEGELNTEVMTMNDLLQKVKIKLFIL